MDLYNNSIKASLYANEATDTETREGMTAIVNSENPLKIKDICISATNKRGADISTATMEYAVNLWFREMANVLCKGFSIDTGWFNVSPNIMGTFENTNEKFDKEKHAIFFDFQQGALIRSAVKAVKVEITGETYTKLAVVKVKDMKSGSVNDLITPKRNLKISGYKLIITEDNKDNGVWFVNQKTKKRTEAFNSEIIKNTYEELIIAVPQLEQGKYKLEVTVGCNGKTTETTVFNKILTVE